MHPECVHKQWPYLHIGKDTINHSNSFPLAIHVYMNVNGESQNLECFTSFLEHSFWEHSAFYKGTFSVPNVNNSCYKLGMP